MTVICPCITAENQQDYQQQLANVSNFAERLHIDLADGIFAPKELISPNNVYWPEQVLVDLHVMHQRPKDILETLIALRPHLIIIHAEAEEVAEVLDQIEGFGIKRGLAILPQTPPEAVKHLLNKVDHILLFSGDLGYFGGTADLSLLNKLDMLRDWRADLEIGWDGGINSDNISRLKKAGVGVMNVGGAIQKADDPKVAYEELQSQIQD